MFTTDVIALAITNTFINAVGKEITKKWDLDPFFGILSLYFFNFETFCEFTNRITYLVYVVCKGPFTPSENEKLL